MNINNKIALERVVASFNQLHYDNQAQGSKYILLYKAIKKCILNMELPYSWNIPSTRVLSETLGLSRTTILKAYELLILEKLIVAKPGSGYKTNYLIEEKSPLENKAQKEITSHLYPSVSENGMSYFKNIALINRDKNDHVAFRPGLPPLDIFPINRWKNLLNIYWRHVKSSGLGYSQSSGLAELKKAVCSYLNVSRNIKCQADQIVIVSGSLQSLYLIANTLIDPNDTVIVENPVFPNVHSVFKSSRASVIPIGLDDHGIAISELQKIDNAHPKLIHVTPSNHYPLGTKMSLQRRIELLEYAEQKGALIIENDYEHEIGNIQEFVPTLFSLDQQDRTIYMGTFNRILHPSMRLGYMLVPRYLKPIVEALQEHSHRFVPPSMQIVMQQFIEKNYLYQHIENCINVAKERFDLFNEEFEKHVNQMTLQEINFASFHRLAFFNQPKTQKEELEIIENLSSKGIKALSLSKCYIGTPEKTGLIFGYAAVRPTVIKQKIQLMGSVIS
jgi:GntR family transcriptional regulator / MocR family aminotransferase